MTTGHLVRNMVITVIVLIAGFFVYRFWWQTPTDPTAVPSGPGLVSVAGVNSPAAAAESDRFLYLLLSLQKLELKSDLFANRIFGQLRDFSTALPNLVPGRSNPFAPLGVGGSPAVESTAGSASGGGAVVGTATVGPAAGDSVSRQQLINSLNQ